jgi:hypothetical protein
MKKNWYWRSMVIFLVFTGCATVPVFTSDPTTQSVENELFVVELEPHLASGRSFFNSFRYVFVNKSDTDLELDWQNTFYLKNGVRFGRWGMKGMTLEQLRELEKQPLITIAPGDTLSGLIFPLSLIAKRSRTAISRDEPTVSPGIIPESESGMDLTVLQGDRVIREKLICRIAVSHMQK